MTSETLHSAPPIQIQIGPHSVEREGPLVHLVGHGDVTFEHMTNLLPIYDECLEQYGYVLILMNMTHIGSVGFSTRKLASDWSKPHAHAMHTAVYGASFAMRSLINLVHMAIRQISKQASMLQFFETEEQGRAWLAGVPKPHEKQR